ncbi:hypothetical protein [Oceanobacillus luteolus]|uniref:Uncharacterized protein n=1 Tax=Oceanobacillus luteolus TaxID=1274358 RepID=A0ABW4HP79_9BACI|nr:hypothetical protein [Oceanobacillus luteolus]
MNQKKSNLVVIAVVGLIFALLLDIKYKGLVYQILQPKKVQS